MPRDSNYVATDIQVLELPDAIRKRPFMYIGPPEGAPTRVLQEVLCKALAGGCRGEVTDIVITIGEPSQGSGDQGNPYLISVADNGPGWEVVKHEAMSAREGRDIYSPEVLLTQIMACRDEKWAEEKKLCTQGIVTTNALSTRFDFETRWNGKRYEMSFSKGRVTVPFRYIDDFTKSGTLITFELDSTIFPNREINLEELVNWLTKMVPDRLNVEIRTLKGSEIIRKNF